MVLRLSFSVFRRAELTENIRVYNLLFGSPGQARTADLVINSHPLYRLSYRGIAVFSEGE